MHIGMIIQSYSGNTLDVANLYKQVLEKNNHHVTLEVITTKNKNAQGNEPIELNHTPDPSLYDCLIFGAPVKGLSLSPIMIAYLTKMPSLKKKKAGIFITEYLPFAWMGGAKSLDQLSQLIEEHQGTVVYKHVINLETRRQPEKIIELIARCTDDF
ncbi:flavodoxin family protein [Lacticigenium naphthae]|uniref:flavodoxin family protein n=1 Tax=Lacticigenium naphthae TaxID=515351 RepID=UPI0004204DE0|nr:hypothetical protein [Lacticigenium naphthae]